MIRVLLTFVGFVLPRTVRAYSITDTGWDCTGFLECGSSGDVVKAITTNIITGVVAFIGAFAVVAFFYGAIRMIVSQGQEGKEAGKKALIYASLGMAAALLTEGIILYVRDYIYFLGT